MKKRDATMRETLLETARRMAEQEGIDGLNIRAIAKKAGVASGTVYNYFSSKDEILLALTKEYWKQALLEMEAALTEENFCDALLEMYAYLTANIHQSAGKLMRSLGGVQQAGQEAMASAQTELKEILLRRMDQDPSICSGVWDEAFTRERFAEFLRMNLMELLKAGEEQIQFFVLVLRRILYEKQEGLVCHRQ